MIGAFNPWLLLVGLFLILGAFGGGYIKGKKDEQAVQVAQELLIEQIARKTQEAAAEAIAQIKIQHTTIQRRVEREVLEKPVYRSAECRHSDDGLRLVNAALTNAADSTPDRKLSGKLGRVE
jgi:hypothetical protein